MDKKEFQMMRNFLEKTRKEMAQLLGLSTKAIVSYEQGWRNIPPHVERQTLFFVNQKLDPKNKKNCWRIKRCKKEKKNKCPAWEFKAGKICWFINGNIADGTPHKSWEEKMKICRQCEILQGLILEVQMRVNPQV